MRAKEFMYEGGYTTPLTQGSKITPGSIGQALKIIDSQFLPDFNKFLKEKGIDSVKLGYPTGSGAHWEHDAKDPETIYGDMDVQLIVPSPLDPTKISSGAIQIYWRNLVSEFIEKAGSKPYLHPENATDPSQKVKKPIINLQTTDPESGKEQYMEVDFMPHRAGKEAEFGRYRTTSEPGMKGKVTGKLFSALNAMFNVQIEHVGGIQYKVLDGEKIPFGQVNKRAEVRFAGQDINNFLLDLFKHQTKWTKPEKVVIDPMLKQNPGIAPESDISKLRVNQVVKGVIGLAKSLEASGMLGKDIFSGLETYKDFLRKYLDIFNGIMAKALKAGKFEKMTSEYDKQRAAKDKEKIALGTDYINFLFANNGEGPSFKEWAKSKK